MKREEKWSSGDAKNNKCEYGEIVQVTYRSQGIPGCFFFKRNQIQLIEEEEEEDDDEMSGTI